MLADLAYVFGWGATELLEMEIDDAIWWHEIAQRYRAR